MFSESEKPPFTYPGSKFYENSCLPLGKGNSVVNPFHVPSSSLEIEINSANYLFFALFLTERDIPFFMVPTGSIPPMTTGSPRSGCVQNLLLLLSKRDLVRDGLFGFYLDRNRRTESSQGRMNRFYFFCNRFYGRRLYFCVGGESLYSASICLVSC